MLARDQRAHLGALLEPRPDRDLRQPFLNRRHQRIGHLAHREHDRDGHATLAGRAVRRAHRRIRGHVDVGVGEHDHVVLRAAQRLHALAVLRPVLVDVARDRRRADEADGRDAGVLEDRVHRHLVALDDVEDAVRHARLLEQLGDVERRRRILLRRLEHERVAARERGRPHPHGHHRGEVERRDAGDDAERLADGVDVDARGRLLGEAALHQRRDAARELDHFEAALHLPHRVREHLAVLLGEDARDLLAAVVDELADAEEELCALRERRRAPRGERRRQLPRRPCPPPRQTRTRPPSSARRRRGCRRGRCGRTSRPRAAPPIQWPTCASSLASGSWRRCHDLGHLPGA